MTKTETPAAAETAGIVDITSAQVARAIDAAVRVPVTKTVKDEKTGEKTVKREVIERKATAADILSFRVDGTTVHAVTCDGQRHQGLIR